MNHRPRKSSQQWEDLINKQEQSQLSQKAFCTKHDVSYASFAKWRQKLRSSNTAFLPVSSQEAPAQSSSFSLSMGCGRFSLSVTL